MSTCNTKIEWTNVHCNNIKKIISNTTIYSIPVDVGLHFVLNRDRGLLVQTKLPHDPVHVVLLDVDVVMDRFSRHPVLLVSQAQGRKTARCPGVNVGCSERSLPHVRVHKSVELSHEVRV